ncbi:hypothetical protein BGX29_003330 [Mortierella sp. GBA35]|nr:hypothetical protein BGX29_003330 [Mortierella sp. GBA35]
MSSTTVPSNNNNNNNNNEAGNNNSEAGNNNNEAGNNNINNNAVAVSAPAPATVSFDDYDQTEMSQMDLQLSATEFFNFDAPPQMAFLPGDPNLDEEPKDNEEEEETEVDVDELLAGELGSLELPTPLTVNQVAAGLGAITLEDTPSVAGEFGEFFYE